MPDRPHYTIDIKDDEMISTNKHLTVHGYIEEDTEITTVKNMYKVSEVKPKESPDGIMAKVEDDV